MCFYRRILGGIKYRRVFRRLYGNRTGCLNVGEFLTASGNHRRTGKPRNYLTCGREHIGNIGIAAFPNEFHTPVGVIGCKRTHGKRFACRRRKGKFRLT